MKKSWLFLGLFLMSFSRVSSYDSFSSGTLSFSDILNSIPSSTIILGTIFIIVFAMLFFSLSKMFRGEKTIAGIVSVALALLITYGVDRSGYDFEALFQSLGLSLSIGSLLLPLVILAAVIIFVVARIIIMSRKARNDIEKARYGSY